MRSNWSLDSATSPYFLPYVVHTKARLLTQSGLHKQGEPRHLAFTYRRVEVQKQII